MKIMISGAGIAGPTLAYWLHHFGFQPTLLEKAPELRTDGYIIDFWGLGFDIAEKMGLRPELERAGYHVKKVRIVNAAGEAVGGFSADVFRRITEGRYVSIPRGELAAAIYRKLDPSIERIFGDEICAIEQNDAHLKVKLASGQEREFDLLIGADGLHSQVRKLVFGAENRFEKFLGYKVAAFETEDYPKRDEDVYLMHSQVGQQLDRFTMRENRTMFLFIFREDDPAGPHDIKKQKSALRKRFEGSGWESELILHALDEAKELYFDRVSQIKMEEWSQGRVTLVGDAAYCASLLAGQGSALAMVGAYVLAGELSRSPRDHAQAFARYQEKLHGFVAKKQKAAEGFGGFFAPRSRFSLFLYNQITKLLSIPFVANFAVGRSLRDKIELPDYELAARQR